MDILLQYVIAFFVFIAVFFLAIVVDPIGEWLWLAVALLVTCGAAALSWWWQVWYPLRREGATPAMRLFKLRVITMDGGLPSLSQFNARWIVGVVDGMFFGVVGLVSMIKTPHHQQIADIVARTLVVRRDEVR